MASRAELIDELVGLIEDRLTKFHINVDMEPERCAHGSFCFGLHMDDPVDLSKEIDRLQSTEEELEQVKQESGIRRELEVQAVERLWVIMGDLESAAYNGLIRVAIASMKSGKTEYLAYEFYALIETSSFNESLSSAVALCRTGLVRRTARSVTRKDGGYAITDGYEVAVTEIVRLFSYTSYLSSLGILYEELKEVAK